MSEWKESTISEFAFVKGGKRLPADKSFSPVPTRFPYLRVTDMVNGSIRDSEIVYVPEDIEPVIRNYKISKDDIYVTIAGTLGNFGTIPDKFHNAQLTENAAKITAFQSHGFDKYFLKYSFLSEGIQSQIRREIGVGGGVPKLALYRIEKLSVFHPTSLPEQRKIARILSTVDAVIEKTEATIAKYKAIKSGMMRDLFTRGIDLKTGKLRPRYEDAPGLYKESELGWVPREWEVERIGDLIHIKHGYSFKGQYFSDEKADFILLTPGNFNVNGELYFIDRNTKYYLGEIPLEFIFNNGDLLVVMTDLTQEMNILGNVIKLDNPSKVLHNQRIGKIEITDHRVSADYLLVVLNTPFSKENVKKTATGTTVRHTSPNNIYRGIVPLPKNSEQNEVAKRLKTIDASISNERTALSKYQDLKSALMSDLLTGKVSVKYNETVEVV